MFCSPEFRLFRTRRDWIRLAAGLAAQALYGKELLRIEPPSEDGLDPALVDLVGRLRAIVAARKHLALEALMASTFRVEFKMGKGPAAFRLHWRPQSDLSPIWGILERLLALSGHRYSDTLYVLPYVCARFPFDLDPLRHVVAVKDAVSLIAEAKPDAPRVGALNRSIVPLAKPVEPPVVIPSDGFIELSHPDIGRCFAASADVYSPAAHRAFFEKRQGQWRWISLAAPIMEDPPGLHPHKSTTR
jgi:hypothetical protein